MILDPIAYTISMFFNVIPAMASYAILKKSKTPADPSNIPFNIQTMAD